MACTEKNKVILRFLGMLAFKELNTYNGVARHNETSLSRVSLKLKFELT